MRTKAEQRERTRAELLRIAGHRFAAHGYAGVALEELVAEAGLTRGAVYHHFGSKEGVFRAVVEQAQAQVAAAVESAAEASAAAAPAGDPITVLESFLAGCRAFLEASLAPGIRRILLIDGPAVLGWGDWREGDRDTSVRLLDAGVAELAAAGLIADRDLDTLATMVSGALNEVAIATADASDPGPHVDAAVATLRRMLGGLRPGSAT